MTPLEAWNIAVAAFRWSKPDQYSNFVLFWRNAPSRPMTDREILAVKTLELFYLKQPYQVSLGE